MSLTSLSSMLARVPTVMRSDAPTYTRTWLSLCSRVCVQVPRR